MKATVFLIYKDDSKVCFEFECNEPDKDAVATLLMVCRGVLMVSMAVRVEAYHEDGSYFCSFDK